MSSTAGALVTSRRTIGGVGIERQILAAVSLAALVLFVGLALILIGRRLTGAFLQPLGGAVIVLIAVAVELAVAAPRWSILSTKYSVLSTQYFSNLSRTSRWSSYLLLIVPSFAVLALLASLSLAGTPAWAIATAWFVVIGGESMNWLLYRVPQQESASAVEEAADEPETPPGLVQRLTRLRESDGESLHALVRAEVPAHDRLAVVHLAFCPPLAARPELTAHAVDAEAAEVRVTQAETFGARIEVRLPQVKDEPREMLVEVLGSVTCP
jgi:hypothetical protein